MERYKATQGNPCTGLHTVCWCTRRMVPNGAAPGRSWGSVWAAQEGGVSLETLPTHRGTFWLYIQGDKQAKPSACHGTGSPVPLCDFGNSLGCLDREGAVVLHAHGQWRITCTLLPFCTSHSSQEITLLSEGTGKVSTKQCQDSKLQHRIRDQNGTSCPASFRLE